MKMHGCCPEVGQLLSWLSLLSFSIYPELYSELLYYNHLYNLVLFMHKYYME